MAQFFKVISLLVFEQRHPHIPDISRAATTSWIALTRTKLKTLIISNTSGSVNLLS